jgi:hypothetical protein
MQSQKERPSAGGIPSLPEGREILPLNVEGGHSVSISQRPLLSLCRKQALVSTGEFMAGLSRELGYTTEDLRPRAVTRIVGRGTPERAIAFAN